MAKLEWDGFGKLMAGLGKLGNPDASDLMVEWERIIVEDNRKGVLAGQDKDGTPMKPVTYRPKGAPTKAKKSGPRGIFAGHGPHAAGLHNNLTSAEYRKLSGPPLAPRGSSSRVITNLFTQHGRDPAGRNAWFAEGAWFEVVSTKGVQFLPFHFNGQGLLPVRDLRGVRPWGRQRAVSALQVWAAKLLEQIG
jgi:hypothetical protein